MFCINYGFLKYKYNLLFTELHLQQQILICILVNYSLSKIIAHLLPTAIPIKRLLLFVRMLHLILEELKIQLPL